MTHRALLALFFIVTIGSVAAYDPAPASAQVAIPQLDQWVNKMVSFGRTHCATLQSIKDGPIDSTLPPTYYDATRVFLQIADYTRDSSWNACAQTARYIYRDRYVLPNNGEVPGYWLFTTGLRLDFARTGDPLDKKAATLLSNSGYAGESAELGWTANHIRSREVAYAILSYIDTEAMGVPKRSRRAQLVNQAYDYFDQWFVRQSWRGTTENFMPFMVGLTAYALIRDWDETKDPRLLPTLKIAADYLWADAWIATDQGMRYQLNPNDVTDGGRSTKGAPDLNQLIAPLYGWLWQQTGDAKYRDQGDALFAGGAARAYLDGPKQFNQNYWSSFDYVKRRSGTSSSTPSTPVLAAPSGLQVR